MTTHVYAMCFSYVKGRFKTLCQCNKNVTQKTKKKTPEKQTNNVKVV